jgi:beta-lactamase superfamily II metal-dependent hydrolase
MNLRRAIPCGLLAALCIGPAAEAQFLRVYYPDIEQGAATLVVAPSGRALLVDGGTDIKSVDEGLEHFINDLIASGIVTSLDYVVTSHYDEDHIGRLDRVFQFVPFPIDAVVYDRGEYLQVPDTFAYSDYAYGASFLDRVTVPVCEVLDLGDGVTARVTTVNGEVCGDSPVDITSADQFENNASVTVVVSYGDFDLWIGGDLTGTPAEGVADVETPTGPQAGDVDIYTINHHGSNTSSNSSFLADIAPEVAINQSSVENDFGHPRITVINRILATPDTNSNVPLIIQQNPSDPTDIRTDDTLADYIADCDDEGANKVIGLAGTIVLLSDGASYRIHACGIPALTLPTDTGGSIGTYPPAIRQVSHTPLVPLAAQTVAVTAIIEDATGANLVWEVGGTPQTPIAMTNPSGDTWTGTIPTQVDGTKVSYRVEATDGTYTEPSAAAGYFSGTTDVADLRQNDGDGVLIPITYGVRVEGSITVAPGMFHATVTQAWVQDSTGGVQVFDNNLLSLNLGDVVTFVGELEQFSGTTEVSIAEDIGNHGYTVVSSGSPPSPAVRTVSQIDEGEEGLLVRINGVTIVSGTIPESGGGNITITDNGGVSTLTLRVDDTTDIPGSDTPTQTFDVIGIVTQFDSWVPFSGGYQLMPRRKADFISDEVNHPQVLIAEIHADPASDITGDANGDGTRDATDDEFIELVNTGFASISIAGWTLSDAGGVRHTFAGGTTLPAREATVVFGGGTPTGAFGNATANSLVFVATGGQLSLNNTGGETVTLKDNTGTVIQTLTYGSEANHDASLVRQPDWSNAPFVRHTLATGAGGAKHSPGKRIDGRAYTVPKGAVLLSEVLYDPTGSDGGLEWIEIYNNTAASIDLSDLCLGGGGGDYTGTLVQLSGTITAGDVFVIGGPTSSSANANPTFNQTIDIDADLQNSGTDADGVALFNQRCARITPTTVPIDAVIYGTNNTSSLIDENGSVGSPDVGDAPGGQSVERTNLGGTWAINNPPDPGSTPLP